ncbi:MAG TPA: ATP-binding protein [Vicinamibacterales bacterium]|jgi:signal transduction histidine kinase/ActR/RegA family two-component response regulator|nr:ATP-binding protein [Vicinamibacterales bacterium]
MKRTPLRRMQIRYKLVAMIMTTSVVVLFTASAGYLISDYYRTRNELTTELEAIAKLVLDNSQAAIQFQDPFAARETLQSLAAHPHLRAACLYDAAGTLFAEYRVETSDCEVSVPTHGYRFDPNRLELTSAGDLAGQRFGSLTLRSDLGVLTTRLRVQVMAVAGLLVLALLVALVLSAKLQSLVSQPVIALAQTAASVTARDDYSIRATRTTDDELGTLVDAFNRMMERIETREAELSKANDELRREVVERRRAEQERAEMLVREREANRVKDEFLATLSHELRTPLNAILGWTKLLRAQAVPPGSLDRALEKVERNAQVQSRLVEDLLEVSRITSGKLRLEQRPLDLVAVANVAIDSIRHAAEARGVAIERVFDAASLPTAGDPDRLQQVIWNLLSNAVKFTPPGGSVTVTLQRADGFDQLAVTDTGIGIEPGFLPHVFDTFRQADASSTRSHGGLGLGLSIVKQLVELHGGTVEVRSDGKDSGARFTVRLPVLTAPRPQPRSVPRLRRGRLNGHTVLVVDDDADTREMLASVIDAAGAQVHAAASAEEALGLGVESPPDAIVSDIAMPGQDGYDLIRHLRAALGARAPRVSIALTAFAGPGDHERALEAGFQRHISKPFDPLALVALLEEMLSSGEPARS